MWKKIQERIFPFIIATSALSVSASAAFYSISGLSKLFAGAAFAVIFIDGFFGIAAGIKREGFQTRKTVRVLKRAVTWIVILTVLLMVEKGFTGTAWLSEVVIIPFVVLQLISALKNASMAGFIKAEELNKILDRIDNHKGFRN